MDIFDAATQAESLSGALAARIGHLERQVQQHEADALARAERRAPTTTAADGGARSALTHLLRNEAKRETREFRRNLAANTESERIEHLKQLTAIDARVAELARATVGEEYEATRKAMQRIHVATQRAVNANRDFERGRVDATAKISMGLAERSVW